MPTDTRALQRTHDKHAASLRTPEAVAARQTVHKERMAVKAALRADLAAINGPILQARRLAASNALAADITAKHGCTAAKALPAAAQMLAQIEADAAVKAVQKVGRAGRIYKANRKREVARRLRQAKARRPLEVGRGRLEQLLRHLPRTCDVGGRLGHSRQQARRPWARSTRPAASTRSPSSTRACPRTPSTSTLPGEERDIPW